MAEKEETLRGIAQRFAEFHKEFSHFYATKTRDGSDVAEQYLKGLVQSSESNMEKMEEKVVGANSQSLQHFITNSPWDERAVLAQVAKEGDKLLGGTEDSCLLIDETSFPKKGKKSVGVGRQYSGTLGKIDNCQMGVFGALVSGNKSLPLDFRLYLPKEWTDNPQRCIEAGIPEDKIRFATKGQLASEIVRTAINNGIRFSWVGADAGYGKDPEFFADLYALNKTFVVDVFKNQSIYFTDPNEPGSERQRVDTWASQQPQELWSSITYRASTKGLLTYDFLHTKVWIKVAREETYREVRLLVRRSHTDISDIKFTVSNAADDISVQRLAYMQGQRYWVERSFRDSKSTLGMSEYQLRKWRGWHHHMSMVALAHLFMLRERILNEEALPLLSMEDVVAMLAFYLPQRDATEEEMFRQMAVRHEKRQRDIDRNLH